MVQVVVVVPVVGAVIRQEMVDSRYRHREYIRRTGEDLPEIRDWVWSGRH